MLNDPFRLTQEKIDSLTDAEIYNKFFRHYDKEADQYEEIKRINEMEEQKPIDKRREEYVELCRSFGFTKTQAEVEWQKWLKEQE